MFNKLIIIVLVASLNFLIACKTTPDSQTGNETSGESSNVDNSASTVVEGAIIPEITLPAQSSYIGASPN